MKKLISVLNLVVILVISCSPKNDSQSTAGVQTDSQEINYLIPAKDFKTKMNSEDVVIIDVRTPAEVSNGYIVGAIHIDYKGDQFLENVSKLDKEKTYMVYCHSGGRSARSKELMNNHGFASVYDLQGGITAWKEAGFATVKE